MMSETTIGWLLLEQAVVAEAALAKTAADHPDHAFYTGKVYAAGYDEPAMLAAAWLHTGAHRVELDGPRLPSISRIAAVRYALALLRHAPSRLDHPPRRDGKAFGGLAKALLLHRDEVFRLTDVVGNSAYLLQTRS